MKRIYLDYAASTPVDPAVFDAMKPYFSEQFGNPGSLHSFGQEAIAAVDLSRETIAKAIGAKFREIIFTGSATEANNLAIHGALIAGRKGWKPGDGSRPRLIVSAIEHESVLEVARHAESIGVDVIFVPVDASGHVDLQKLKESLNETTMLVSIMYANNEIGTVQNIKAIRAAAPDALLHIDAAQAFQFFDCNVKELGIDLMTLSSHKIYGPKGIGALYIKEGIKPHPILDGGGQEFGFRSGTENVPAIVGFAKAVELAVAVREKESKRIAELRDTLWDGIKKIFSDAELNGSGETVPNMLNVYFPGREAQDMLTKLDRNGVAASSGSACRSRAFESSYVIEALGHNKERAKASVRFSLGRLTTIDDIEEALKIMKLF